MLNSSIIGPDPKPDVGVDPLDDGDSDGSESFSDRVRDISPGQALPNPLAPGFGIGRGIGTAIRGGDPLQSGSGGGDGVIGSLSGSLIGSQPGGSSAGPFDVDGFVDGVSGGGGRGGGQLTNSFQIPASVKALVLLIVAALFAIAFGQLLNINIGDSTS